MNCLIKILSKLILFLIMLVGLSSCVKEDIKNISNSVLLEEASVPLGPRELSIRTPNIRDTSNIPGLYGSFFYNNLKFPNKTQSFNQIFGVDFNLNDAEGRSAWIKHLEFLVVIENRFPTNSYSQVYLLNSNYTFYDSIFKKGPVYIDAAQTDNTGKVIKSSFFDTTIVYQGDKLEQVKKTNFLLYKTSIFSRNNTNTPIRLDSTNIIRINLAARMKLEIPIKDQNK